MPSPLNLTTQDRAKVAGSFMEAIVNKFITLHSNNIPQAEKAAGQAGEDLIARLFAAAPETTDASKLSPEQIADIQKGKFPISLLNDEGLLNPAIVGELQVNMFEIKERSALVNSFVEQVITKLRLDRAKPLKTIQGAMEIVLREGFNPQAVTIVAKSKEGSTTLLKSLVDIALADSKLNIVTLLNNWIKLQKYK